ncbi:long-chain-fatty-acid--CoA ligase [Lentzea sp. NBRC 105346]|uniref:class I adenylate-forming enzyme family protein n=1 Tax=Lentzea sp. NBRC 105346 TaxID=3032205 RepID=UPI0024A46E75|nr:class I adenylate-forming enzyme family protein [Lentzea sp. NBRC 105346]GLZ32251.1 long-chain-fatty-acid--CoA ligase [Lentzea sp. NBRC 105346]
MTTIETQLSWWGEHLLAGDDHDAVLVHGEHVITRRAVREQVTAEALIFASHGIGPGSTVALRLPPSFTSVWALLALWSLGAQVLLLDHRLKPDEVERMLKLCRPAYYVRSLDPPTAVTSFRNEYEVFVEWRRDGRDAESEHRLVQLSSGSTGRPKVIGRTAESLLAEIDRFSLIDGMPRRGERVLLLNSTIHSFGLVGGLLHGLNSGATTVFTPKLQPEALLRTLVDQEINAVFGVPFHFDLLSRARHVPALPSLRLAVSGGERLTAEVHQRFLDRYGVRIGQAYGMTEVGIIATDLAGEFPLPAVGRPAPGVPVSVVDGELRIGLPATPYLQQDEKVRFADGWLRSFDLCTLDGDVLSVTGRADSLVAIGGLKVDLTEIEAVLAEHPAVAEVVVVHGEGIEAHVGSPDGVCVSDLAAFCRTRLSNYKIPKRFTVLPALPRTANGKLLRNAELLGVAR